MSIVHGDEAEPQVLAGLHMLSGWSSAHVYLPFFCACAIAQFSKMTQDNKSNTLRVLHSCCGFIIIVTYPTHPRWLLRRLLRRETLILRLRAFWPPLLPLDDVSQFPRILVEFPLQLAFLVDNQLCGGEEDTRTFVFVFVI